MYSLSAVHSYNLYHIDITSLLLLSLLYYLCRQTLGAAPLNSAQFFPVVCIQLLRLSSFKSVRRIDWDVVNHVINSCKVWASDIVTVRQSLSYIYSIVRRNRQTFRFQFGQVEIQMGWNLRSPFTDIPCDAFGLNMTCSPDFFE